MKDLMRTAQELPLLNDSDIALNLTSQRIKAKELRDAVRSGDPGAYERVQNRHPRPHAVDFGSFKLTDAQCVIAREAGLSSWPALKAHVESMEAARVAIEANTSAPDGDLRTLHIRCGNDIERPLHRAGFCGSFLMFADPICQGPISSAADALEQRARFIASGLPGGDYAKSLARLAEEEAALDRASDFARIVLWFEHDPYDQLLLCRILTRLRSMETDKRLIEIVSLDRFPGFEKFIGIGQLSPAALRHMYSRRQSVPTAAFRRAEQVWQALTASTPEPLYALSLEHCDELPFFVGALKRYLAELPDVKSGLSFTERSALSLLQDGPLAWGRIFSRFMREIDPLPFHGDLMFYADLYRLSQAGDPPVRLSDFQEQEVWGQQVMELTETGRDLLAGIRDLSACGPLPRQLAGITCFARPDWRYDPKEGKVLSAKG